MRRTTSFLTISILAAVVTIRGSGRGDGKALTPVMAQ